MKQLVSACWRLFISLKLTFVCLVFLGLGAVLGMSFDQTRSYDEFVKNYQQHQWASFLNFFELYDAYHSWWFSFALLILALNLIACSIERLPRIYFDYFYPRPYLSARRKMGLPNSEVLFVKDRAAAIGVVENFCAAPSKKIKMPHGIDYFYLERHGLGRFGVYIVHIALLIIMFSSMYATQMGVDGHMEIEEGNKARFVSARGASGVLYNYDLGFFVGCDDFRLRTFVDNSPMEFESDLYIKNGEDISAKKTVRVNEPLNFAGFTFYQSSYRPIISDRLVQIEVNYQDGSQERLKSALNMPIKLKNQQSIVLEKIYDDFGGLGQALRVSKKNAANDSTYFHIFRRHKDFDRIRADDFALSFVDVDQHYATGLSVGYVPGIGVIFFGFVVLLMGLYMSFFMMPLRYFARIITHQDRVELWLAMSGYRMPAQTKRTFISKIHQIQTKFAEQYYA